MPVQWEHTGTGEAVVVPLPSFEKIKEDGKPFDAGEGTTSFQIPDKRHHHNMKLVYDIDFSTAVVRKRLSFVGWRSEWKVYGPMSERRQVSKFFRQEVQLSGQI